MRHKSYKINGGQIKELIDEQHKINAIVDNKVRKSLHNMQYRVELFYVFTLFDQFCFVRIQFPEKCKLFCGFFCKRIAIELETAWLFINYFKLAQLNICHYNRYVTSLIALSGVYSDQCCITMNASNITCKYEYEKFNWHCPLVILPT